MSIFSGKVAGRKVTQVTGSLVFDIVVDVPGAKAGDPTVSKTFKAQLAPAQMATYVTLGFAIPKVGDVVNVEQSPNPVTGEVSKDWVTLCA